MLRRHHLVQLHVFVQSPCKGRIFNNYDIVLFGNFPNAQRDFIHPLGHQNRRIHFIGIDPRRDIFEAALVAPSKETPVKRLSLMGQVERMVAVPILKSTLRNGDIIGKHDLNWIEMPARQIQHDTLLKEKNLVGMTPQRISFAGKPLLASDLESPKLVERGDIITITFKDGPLFLSTKGKALQSGAKGEIDHRYNDHKPIR